MFQGMIGSRLGSLIAAPRPAEDKQRSGQRSCNAWSISLVFGLLCLQWGLFLALAAHHLDTRSYLTVHFGLSAVIAIAAIWWAWASPTIGARDNAAIVVQLALWTILGGPFGLAIAAMLLVPRSSQAGQTEAGTAARAGRSDLTRFELLHNAMLDHRLRLEHAHLIRPLLDVILDGSQTEKLDALSLIAKRYTPDLAPVLRRALEDKEASVRVLAATVIAQQHRQSADRRVADYGGSHPGSVCKVTETSL
jgi:hypothetical protein